MVEARDKKGNHHNIATEDNHQPKPVLFDDNGSIGKQQNPQSQESKTSASYRPQSTSSPANRRSRTPVIRIIRFLATMILLTLLLAVISILLSAQYRQRVGYRPLRFVDLECGQCAPESNNKAEIQPQQDDVQTADQDAFIISGFSAIDPTVLN